MVSSPSRYCPRQRRLRQIARPRMGPISPKARSGWSVSMQSATPPEKEITQSELSLRGAEGDVEIPGRFREGRGIATPVCGLVRNDLVCSLSLVHSLSISSVCSRRPAAISSVETSLSASASSWEAWGRSPILPSKILRILFSSRPRGYREIRKGSKLTKPLS